MRGFVLLALAALLPACARHATPRISPEQMAVYVAGRQPRFDDATYRVVGHFAVTGGGTVTRERMLRNVRVEAARRGAEYVVLLGPTKQGLSQFTADNAAPNVADVEALADPYSALVAVAVARR